MMALSVALQGLYFWARDAVTPDLPAQFLTSDVVWFVTLCSLALYRRHPWITIACSWALLFTTTVVLWKFSFYHTWARMVIMSSAATTNVFFAHLGLHLREKRQRVKSPTDPII